MIKKKILKHLGIGRCLRISPSFLDGSGRSEVVIAPKLLKGGEAVLDGEFDQSGDFRYAELLH